MVFIAWVLIFYHSGKSQNIEIFFKALTDSDMLKDDVFKGLITALPIGVIIHQISVSIKNHLVGKTCKELDDIPKKGFIEKLKKRENGIDKVEYTKHILDKISNLNSFYYVRFDNGFLAPFLALIVVLSSGYQVSSIAVAIAIGLGYVMLYYIKRICEELKVYFSMLDSKSTIYFPKNLRE